MSLHPIHTLLFSASLLAQTPAPTKPALSTESPVGHWVAEHTSKQELGLWWDFRADGTVTATVGGIVNGTYKLDGKQLSISSPDTVQTSATFDVRFADGKLFSTAHAEGHPPTMEFSRVGPLRRLVHPSSGPGR
ncbi:hypothetical protein GRAN_4082 [Granulicella sibirica]|uniref:Uncharacterized protein n=2 Tax=Granulicella sibirica TaxID=2479048 RepID=A0A4Q0SZB9_9BACT|nr:hypothetical protein GRAN_4082 [Granulicella sibirica]